MKLISVEPDPIEDGLERVVVEIDGRTHAWVGIHPHWTVEETGKDVQIGIALELAPLLWLHRRAEAKKRLELLGSVTLTNAGKVVAESADHGTTWTPVSSSASERTKVAEDFVRFSLEMDAIAAQRPPPFDGGTLTAEEFAEGAECVESPPGVVLNQRAVETMGVVLCGGRPSDPREVYVPRAVTVALVEAPENVVVCGLAPAHEVFVDTGRTFPWVSLEASTEGLRKLHEVIVAELRRREEG